MQHKLGLAESELEKLEGSLKEHKSAKEEAGQHKDTNESLTRKISLLEEELDNAEKNLRETTEKCVKYFEQAPVSSILHRRLRQVDVKAEHYERQVTRVEQERDQWETKFEEAQSKYLASKKELDELAGQVRGALKYCMAQLLRNRRCLHNPAGIALVYFRSVCYTGLALIGNSASLLAFQISSHHSSYSCANS